MKDLEGVAVGRERYIQEEIVRLILQERPTPLPQRERHQL